MEKELLLKQLEKRVDELLSWKQNLEKERLTFPLEYLSQQILDQNPYSIIPTGNEGLLFHNLLETAALAFGLTIKINGKRRIILCMFPVRRFTTNFTTDTITNVDGNHGLYNGDTIVLTTDTTLPDPLNNSTLYYVINRTETTFKLALTPGGLTINLTDNGTGNHYWSK